VIALVLVAAAALGAAPAPVEVPGFGRVEVHAPDGAPSRVVLLLSGAGGLDAGAKAVAAGLAGRGALVLAIDTPAYLERARGRRCVYPAGDLEVLAQDVEKRLGLPAYLHPALVGHSRGAQVVWAALTQAPEGTFAAGVALAPCPGHPLGVKLCAGAGPEPRATADGDLPADEARPSAPFVVVAGQKDQTCPAPPAEAFARARGAAYAVVPGAGHALAPTEPWVEAIAAWLEKAEAGAREPPASPGRR
jgi:type IV secretory pathway VirJ component